MNLNQKIVDWAKSKPLKSRHGDGECWTYVEDAVVQAGGKSSKTLTNNFGPHADYVWGKPVPIAAVQSGDLVQFKNYKWTNNTKVKIIFSDGWYTPPKINSQTRPHHSAIVEKLLPDGTIQVLEQNVPKGTGIIRSILRLKSIKKAKTTTKENHINPRTKKPELATVETTVDEIVTGNVWVYRAIKK